MIEVLIIATVALILQYECVKLTFCTPYIYVKLHVKYILITKNNKKYPPHGVVEWIKSGSFYLSTTDI